MCATRIDLAAASSCAATAAAPFSILEGVCAVWVVVDGCSTAIVPAGASAPLWFFRKIRGIDRETVALDGRRSGTADNPLEEVFPLRDDFVLFIQTENSPKMAEAKRKKKTLLRTLRLELLTLPKQELMKLEGNTHRDGADFADRCSTSRWFLSHLNSATRSREKKNRILVSAVVLVKRQYLRMRG